MLNPAWSPDGNLIAFSGLVGGFNDLFVYDLAASIAAAADQRTRSPSSIRRGRRTAGSSRSAPIGSRPSCRRSSPAHLRLAVMDVASGSVREAGGFDDAKNISPQWARDGRSLYFLSDRQGITNIYRTPLDGGTPSQLTNILTGVSGITALSPALSVGGRPPRVQRLRGQTATTSTRSTPSRQLAGGAARRICR